MNYFFLTFLILSSCSTTLIKHKSPLSIEQTHKSLFESEHMLQAIDFEKISIQKLSEYFTYYLDISKKRLTKIKSLKPSFANTVINLETISKEFSQALNLLAHYKSVKTNDETEKVFQKHLTEYKAFYNEVSFDQELYKMIDSVYKNRHKNNFSSEDTKLIEDLIKDFKRNGVALSSEKKEKLKQITKELAQLSQKYSKNLLEHKKSLKINFSLSELKGVSPTIIASLKKGNQYQLSAVGYAYIDVLKYAQSQKTRRKVYVMMSKLGNRAPYHNEGIVRKISKLRFDKATLLGHQNFSEFTLEDRMAKNITNVETLLTRLKNRTRPYKEKFNKDLLKFINSKRKYKISRIMPWDRAFYTRQYKEERFQFNEEELKPYLELNQTLKGVFKLAQDLFGLKFIDHALPTYDPDVKSYLVKDLKDKTIGIFYFDFYASDQKRGGAWMKSLRPQSKGNLPHVINVLNLTKPKDGSATLLKLSEAETLVHEFGHALHGLLSNVSYASLSGTNVPRDFVEVPSMLFEKFLYTPLFLKQSAKHYKTGELCPDKLIKKAILSKTFNQAYQIFMQSSYSLIDLHWHNKDPSSIGNILKFEDEIFERKQWEREIPRRVMSQRFSHIFSGGYASGYYTYMWSETFAADGFEFFTSDPKLVNEKALKYARSILSQGGLIDPISAYKQFKGSDVDPEAIFRVNGISK